MIAHTRNISRIFSQTYKSDFKNLLVSGCSYVWNNSEEHACTWPYYLRDLSGFDKVLDCSQSGAGSNHIFNSIVYETETNHDVNPKSTLIIVMWSGLSRHDIIATRAVTSKWHQMSNYNFDEQYSTFSIFANSKGNDSISALCRDYWKIVDFKSQILESAIKILTLKYFLKSKGFNSVFLSWKPIIEDLSLIEPSPMIEKVIECIDSVVDLDTYAETTKQRIPNDGHPTPDAHLQWTKEHLLPYLSSQKILLPL